MKNITIRLLILAMMLVIDDIGYSQQDKNYIKNYDFENLKLNSYPDDQGQVDLLQNWETRTKIDAIQGVSSNYWLHSPDLYTNSFIPTISTTVSIPPQAHSGSNYVGMLPYELIEQEFDNDLMEGDGYYTFSAYIYLPTNNSSWWNDNQFTVFLAKNRIEYEWENKAVDMCKQGYVTYNTSNNTRFEIGTIDLSSVQKGQWHKISFTFKAPSDVASIDGYDYIVLDMIKPNYNPNSCGTIVPCTSCHDGGYLFIDDLSLENAEMCGAYCAPNLGNLHFTHELHNGLIATTMPWFFAIENAIGIELDVFDRWGGHVYHQDAFDVNGLKDVGYSDYMFGWMGVLANGSVLQQGVYVFKLKIWNCHQTFYNERDVTYVVGNGGGTQGWDIHNYTLNNCCPDNLYFQNQVISGTQKFGADKFIYAGSNVTSGTQGPVVISGGSSIKFIAGQNIFLSPGFSVAQGGTFEGFIDECYTFKLMEIDDRRYHMETFMNQKMYDQEAFITIYPNPNQGNFTIQSNRLKGQSGVVKIYDMLGNVLYEEHIVECSSNQIALHLEKLEKGLYQVSLITSKETIPYLTTLIIN